MTEQPKERTNRKDRRRGWWQVALILLFLGGAFLAAWYLAGLQTTPAPDDRAGTREPVVETVRVAPETHRLRFSTTGSVRARALTDIVPQVGGRVVDISESAFPGGRFTTNTVLFRIDDEDYRLRVRQLEAEVARAETELKLQQARSTAAEEEWRRLNPDRPVPPLVGEQPQLEQARSALRAAEARLAEADLNLARTAYTLPFAGRITEFRLEQGQYVVAGQSYGQAYRLDVLEVDVPLTSRQFGWLMQADPPQVTVRAGYASERVGTGFVKRIASTVDPRTQFARVFVGVRGDADDLLPGAFVTVDIGGPVLTNIWELPLDALQEDGSVWIVTPEHTLALRWPRIVRISEDAVIAQSDGTAIVAVRGDMSQATTGTPVRVGARQQEAASRRAETDFD